MSTIINGSTGITFPDSSVQAAAASPYVLKNRIINGAMQIWQRNTTYALTTSWAYGSVDRWAFIQGSSAASNASQVTSGLSGFQYALKIGRTASSALTNPIQMLQVVESSNSIDLSGQSVTLSFWAKAGTNFSGANISVGIGTGTGTDQGSAIWGIWTGWAYALNTTQVITTTWTRYSFTTTIPSNVNELGVNFNYTPTGTAGADDNFYLTGVQLEVGSTATPFERRLYGHELANCQRYYWRLKANNSVSLFANGLNTSTTASRHLMTFPVPMRTNPSSLETSGTASDYRLWHGSGTTTNLSAVPVLDTATEYNANLSLTVASGLTGGAYSVLIANTGTSAYLGWNAEL